MIRCLSLEEKMVLLRAIETLSRDLKRRARALDRIDATKFEKMTLEEVREDYEMLNNLWKRISNLPSCEVQ